MRPPSLVSPGQLGGDEFCKHGVAAIVAVSVEDEQVVTRQRRQQLIESPTNVDLGYTFSLAQNINSGLDEGCVVGVVQEQNLCSMAFAGVDDDLEVMG